MLCDAFFVFAYPELYAVVGGQVPNYQGYFLRGVGGSSAGLGQAQGDAMQNLTGEFWLSGAFGGSSGVWPGSGSGSSGAFSHDGARVSVNVGLHNLPMFIDTPSVKFDASRQVRTAEENRPVNKAVRYLIRAKP